MRWLPKVQKRLPIQLTRIAMAVEMVLAMMGPDARCSGLSTVARSRLNTATSTTRPTAPTAPNFAACTANACMRALVNRAGSWAMVGSRRLGQSGTH